MSVSIWTSKSVEQPSHEIEMVVGLRDRTDPIGSIASEPRPDPFVAPEFLLEESIAVVNVAAKCCMSHVG